MAVWRAFLAGLAVNVADAVGSDVEISDEIVERSRWRKLRNAASMAGVERSAELSS